jgi:hypothetical protein
MKKRELVNTGTDMRFVRRDNAGILANSATCDSSMRATT